jgi:hypothetical protein
MNAVKIALLALTLLPASALAQPVRIELQAVDANQPLRLASVVAPQGSSMPAPTALTQPRLDYNAAYNKKVAGIVILSVGGGGAVLLGFFAIITSLGEGLAEGVGDHYPEDRQKSHASGNLAIAAICSLGIGVSVGLPLLIWGVVQGRRIRRAQQQLAAGAVELTAGPGQAGLGLRVHF